MTWVRRRMTEAGRWSVVVMDTSCRLLVDDETDASMNCANSSEHRDFCEASIAGRTAVKTVTARFGSELRRMRECVVRERPISLWEIVRNEVNKKHRHSLRRSENGIGRRLSKRLASGELMRQKSLNSGRILGADAVCDAVLDYLFAQATNGLACKTRKQCDRQNPEKVQHASDSESKRVTDGIILSYAIRNR